MHTEGVQLAVNLHHWIAKTDCEFRHVCLSISSYVPLFLRMEQLDSQWYFSIFREYVEKI